MMPHLPDGIVNIFAIGAMMLVGGGLIGLLDRRSFSLRWLLVAILLVLVNDALLTNFYHAVPDAFVKAQWNWQGKILALAATLSIAALPAFGWRRTGLTLAQRPGSLKTSIPVAALYCLFFLGIALAFPSGHLSGETIAFQLTMPGFEEEPFYRGILLLALSEAFRGRIRLLGIDWGWGAVFSCAIFGLAHAFGYSGGAFTFDPLTMALTALPAFIAVWLRERTGSLVLPIVLHNFGNSISLMV